MAGAGFLLAPDEPGVVQVQEPERSERSSSYVILCDHAGRRLPRAVGSLGLTEQQLRDHIAWDIGAGAVAHRLGTALDATVVAQTYSRLVIDCNRPLTAADSIATESEWTSIPGNQGLDQEEADRRAREVFHPYHQRIRDELDSRVRLGRPSAIVALHSFTPVFKGVARPWQVGVLFNRDRRLADILLCWLADEPHLTVGCNEPYAASPDTDYSLIQHGENRDLPCVELEIRQDLIAEESGQTAWAERLARLLRAINLLQL